MRSQKRLIKNYIKKLRQKSCTERNKYIFKRYSVLTIYVPAILMTRKSQNGGTRHLTKKRARDKSKRKIATYDICDVTIVDVNMY